MTEGEILNTLIDLQKADNAVLAVEKEGRMIDAEIEEKKKRIEEFKAEFNEKKARLDEFKRKKAALDLEIKSREADILKKEGQGASIKTNDAFKALQDEIARDKDEIRKTEDKILGIEEEEEEVKIWIKEQEGLFKKEEERLGAEIKTLEAQKAEKNSGIAALAAEREKKAAVVDKQWFEKYEKIRKAKGGVAVASVTRDARGDGSCDGCRMAIRAQMVIKLRKRQNIEYCANCARILYVPE
ncbi:MAG TPA: hypothetical protein PLB12_00955 [Candidatus Goldiibacteriota bacterium]|nr:hypothetical protein [Candidatus Goldiibacteriota bacterium]HPN65220.1 hypothetical protein [Candidatus Goldiibacteriota bacterium]HRQ42902.1 hypothetical protein [Candidatus Goldiibacteriota bacterium]